MKDTKYNGWTNWETWNFKLWLDNDLHANWLPTLKNVDNECKTYELSRWLESHVADDWKEIQICEREPGFFHDVCNMAIREVNFFEIAEHLIEERENDS
tara:strand:+ start:223 stop:519 length:297 start_codon:yes stop_codon:yes gene_type:complete